MLYLRLLFWLSLFIPCLVTAAEKPFAISGFNEAVLSVSDIEAYQTFFTETAGWQQRYSGAVSREQLVAWGLTDSKVAAREVLMANPGTQSGFIRLLQFSGVEQQYIRSNDQSWDTGGIFNLNIRVRDMDASFQQLQRLNWQALTDPVAFTFGKFTVKEWLVRGPDGVRFALIERLRPTLEGWPHLKKFSRTFNSTQIVRDMDASLAFYRDVLGFKNYMEHHGASPEAGPNVLGLPHNLTTEIPRAVHVLHPQAVNEGSIELLAYKGATGRDFSSRAVLPNLGIAMLRFPVTNIDALYRHMQASDVSISNRLSLVDIAPYGAARRFVARAPEGALLEFYELID